MITNIKDKWGNIPTLNFGVAFLQIFIWLNLVLIALLFEKGLDSIFNIFDFNSLHRFEFSVWPPNGNITWTYTLYFLLFVNYLIFSVRYIFWSPWPIYNNMFDLNEKAHTPNYTPNNSSKGLFSYLKFNRLVWGLTNVNGFDLFWSITILFVEFFIVYLGIKSFGNIQITIGFIILLPLIDFIIPFISYLFKIRFSSLKKIKNIFNKKINKDSFKNKDWFLPWVFLRPFIYDLFIPLIILSLSLLYIWFIDYTDSNFFEINFYNISEKNQFILVISTVLSLSITNYLVAKFLKQHYYNVGHVLFRLSDVNSYIESEYRPTAYKNGSITFMGTELIIDERVYPPTKETEFLVKKALEELKDKYKTKKIEIIDVGTGSGNIAIQLSKELEKIEIHAIDISDDALTLAKENIDKHNIKNIVLKQGDLLYTIDTDRINNPDLIIANLPYGSEDYLLDSNKFESIKYMPEQAVFPRNGIIGDYISLVEDIKSKEWNTTLLLETGPIPEKIILEEFPDDVLGNLDYELITEGKYSILKIKFN